MSYSSKPIFYLRDGKLFTTDIAKTPVVNFFNDIFDFSRSFLKNLERVVEGNGNLSMEYETCERFDPKIHIDELPFCGLRVRVGWPEDVSNLSDEEFKHILRIFSEEYVQINPQSSGEINAILSKMQ